MYFTVLSYLRVLLQSTWVLNLVDAGTSKYESTSTSILLQSTSIVNLVNAGTQTLVARAAVLKFSNQVQSKPPSCHQATRPYRSLGLGNAINKIRTWTEKYKNMDTCVTYVLQINMWPISARNALRSAGCVVEQSSYEWREREELVNSEAVVTH